MGTIIKELWKALPLAQKLHCPYHWQSQSEKTERTNGILKIREAFRNSLALLARSIPISPYGQAVYYLKDTFVINL